MEQEESSTDAPNHRPPKISHPNLTVHKSRPLDCKFKCCSKQRSELLNPSSENKHWILLYPNFYTTLKSDVAFLLSSFQTTNLASLLLLCVSRWKLSRVFSCSTDSVTQQTCFQQSNLISQTCSHSAVIEAQLYLFHGVSANSCGNYLSWVCFVPIHAVLGQIWQTVHDPMSFLYQILHLTWSCL